MPRPTAIVYIDGFNLYRRCLEQHPDVKWLDLLAFARNLLPYCEIKCVHYFTARVRSGTSPDRQTPQRQQAYLRALETFRPSVRVHMGKFRIDKRLMMSHPLEIDPDTNEYRRVAVKKIEEKGSDVNLAARMIADAFTRRADFYVMLTNDSDQTETLRLVREEADQVTGLILPMESARASKDLIKAAPSFVGYVTREVLESSQLPDELTDKNGRIHRPKAWSSHSEGPRHAPEAF